MKHLYAFALIGLASIVQAQNLNDSLIAHFPLNGNPNDVIGSLAPTVTSGTPSFCQDRFGNADGAACFDGASFWSYGDVLDLDTSDFSISFWFRTDAVTGSRPVTKGNTLVGDPVNAGYSFGFGDDGNGGYVGSAYVFDDLGNESFTNVPVVLSEWAQIVASRCDTTLSVHLNGTIGSQTTTSSHGDLGSNIVFSIGALDRNPTSAADGSFFIGALDDIRIYRGRCLSQTEIDTLYYDTTVAVADYPRNTSSLLVYPNPAEDRITLTNTVGRLATFTLLDATSRVIVEHRMNRSTLELDIAKLLPGTYVVTLRGEQWQAHGRFIKQ